MFKQILTASTLVIALTTYASAETLFRGTLQVTAVNAACTDGPTAGDISNSQYHPAAVPGNSNFSALNQYENFNARSWRQLAAGSFTSVFQQASNVGIGWSDYTPDRPSFISASSQVPATLTATTPSVTLVGRIKNFYGDIGQENCIASFRFVGVRRLPN